MRHLFSIFLVAVLVAMLSGCPAKSTGKKKKHNKGGKTATVERAYGAVKLA